MFSPASANKDAGLTHQEEERGTRDRATGGKAILLLPNLNGGLYKPKRT